MDIIYLFTSIMETQNTNIEQNNLLKDRDKNLLEKYT